MTRRQNGKDFGNDPLAVPERAISLGLVEILAARHILLVVTGREKAGVLKALLEEPPSEDLPASWLKLHPAVTVMLDRAAASELADEPDRSHVHVPMKPRP